MTPERRTTSMIWTLGLIFLAGGLGALARYSLGGWVQNMSGSSFPWGTFTVNILGAFLFGLVFAAATERGAIGATARLVILTGFIGAFTTFSTLAFETNGLIRDSEWLLAAANYLGQGAAGIIAVILGMTLGRLV